MIRKALLIIGLTVVIVLVVVAFTLLLVLQGKLPGFSPLSIQ